LQVTGSKGTNIWDAISDGMCNMGYNCTAKNCKEKWENINKHFKKSVGSVAKKPFENITVSPYTIMDLLIWEMALPIQAIKLTALLVKVEMLKPFQVFVFSNLTLT
jgi:hypothetical protein